MEAGPRCNRFVLVAHPRSGSNFLREILIQHPEILMVGEIFHTDPVILRYLRETANPFQEPGGHEADLFPPGTWDNGPLGLADLEPLVARGRALTGRETFGFSLFAKAMGHALEDGEAVDLLLQDDVLPILLVRKNLLKAFVSVKRACATEVWHLDPAGAFIPNPFADPRPNAMMQLIPPLDPREAVAWIEANRLFLDRVEGALAGAGKPFLRVTYEDLCLGAAGREIDRIVAFLGLEPMPPYGARTSQTASAEFYDSIPNRQELMDATGCDLEPPRSSPHGWAAALATPAKAWREAGRTLAIAPAGRFARGLPGLDALGGTRLVGFFDRDPEGSGGSSGGLPIHGYPDLDRVRPDVVLVASPFLEDEIVEELRSRGWPKERTVRLSRLLNP